MNETEQAKLDRARAALGPCVENRHALLGSFVEQIGLGEGAAVEGDAGQFVPGVSAWVEEHGVGTAEEAGFVLLRVALLIGEVLVQRLGGRWMLDEEPGSPHFASYVVGSFEGIRNRNAAVGPFVIARDYVVGVRGRAEGRGRGTGRWRSWWGRWRGRCGGLEGE